MSDVSAVRLAHYSNRESSFLSFMAAMVALMVVYWVVRAYIAPLDRDPSFSLLMPTLFFTGAIAVIASSRTAPLLISLGMTRLRCFRSSWIVAAASAVAWSAFFIIEFWLERATDGWGIGLTFSPDTAGGLHVWWQLGLYVFAAHALVYAAGQLAGVIYLRWRGIGLVVAAVIGWASAVLVVVAIAGFQQLRTGDARWEVSLDLPDGPVTRATVIVAIAAALAGVTWRVLRRTAV